MHDTKQNSKEKDPVLNFYPSTQESCHGNNNDKSQNEMYDQDCLNPK